QGLDPAPGGVAEARGEHERSRAQAREPREGEVLRDREPEGQALALAVLAEQAHALLPSPRRRGCARPGADTNAPGADGLQAEERPQEPRASRAHEAGDTEHLSAAQREPDFSAADPLDLDDRLSRMALRAREEVLHAAADHEGHDLLARRARGGAAARVPSIAQHDEAIGHLLHLFDEVRDVDDGVTVRLEPAHEIEQAPHVRAAQAARGLVEDEDARADGERTRDLDELL